MKIRHIVTLSIVTFLLFISLCIGSVLETAAILKTDFENDLNVRDIALSNALKQMEQNNSTRTTQQIEVSYAVGCELQGGTFEPPIFDSKGVMTKPLSCRTNIIPSILPKK